MRALEPCWPYTKNIQRADNAFRHHWEMPNHLESGFQKEANNLIGCLFDSWPRPKCHLQNGEVSLVLRLYQSIFTAYKLWGDQMGNTTT